MLVVRSDEHGYAVEEIGTNTVNVLLGHLDADR